MLSKILCSPLGTSQKNYTRNNYCSIQSICAALPPSSLRIKLSPMSSGLLLVNKTSQPGQKNIDLNLLSSLSVKNLRLILAFVTTFIPSMAPLSDARLLSHEPTRGQNIRQNCLITFHRQPFFSPGYNTGQNHANPDRGFHVDSSVSS